MDHISEDSLAAARRCQALTEHYLGALPDQDVPGRAILDHVIAQVERLGARRQRAFEDARAETQRQHVLESVLRSKHLHPIVSAMDRQLGTEPSPYVLPHRHLTGMQLVTEARCTAAYAQQRQQALIEGGLPPSFLADMLRVADMLENSLSARTRHRETARETAPAIALQLRRARYALDAIESVLRQRYATNPQVLAAWRAARSLKQRSHASTRTGRRTAESREAACAR